MQTLHDFLDDLRFAVRTLRRSPVAGATIVLCLGFSIGATGTVFAWMDSIIFQPLPAVGDLAPLVSLKVTTVGGELNLSYPDYRDVLDAERRAGTRAFLVNRVTAGYFATMGIPIVRGRAIESADRDGARPVAVVNETFARRFWGSKDPIDRGIHVDGRDLTVVGVAAAGKYFFLAPLDAPSPPFVYLPFAQWGNFAVVLHARATGDALALVPSIQRAVAAVDGRLTVMSPGTLDSYS